MNAYSYDPDMLQRAKEARGKRLLYKFEPVTGRKLYFCGANDWTSDRDAAVRFNSPAKGFLSERA